MNPSKPRTLIIRTAGTNCDLELVHAFELADATAERVHLHRLIDEPARLAEYDIIGLPGGFSYGDDIAAGRILANRLRHRLLEPLLAAIDRGVPILGICNGFQVLVKLGLLPFPHGDQAEGGGPRQVVTLADNTDGRFVDRWVPLTAEPASPCVWTQGVGELELPIAHGEGRFAASVDVLDQLEATNQIALRYTENPNGSSRDIAGVCDPSGRVLGLMPHPERYVAGTQHPAWTRRGDGGAEGHGLALFRNAVRAVGAAASV